MEPESRVSSSLLDLEDRVTLANLLILLSKSSRNDLCVVSLLFGYSTSFVFLSIDIFLSFLPFLTLGFWALEKNIGELSLNVCLCGDGSLEDPRRMSPDSSNESGSSREREHRVTASNVIQNQWFHMYQVITTQIQPQYISSAPTQSESESE